MASSCAGRMLRASAPHEDPEDSAGEEEDEEEEIMDSDSGQDGLP